MISDWSDLQTILAIANEGSLSGAARALGVSQSTVSRRLQAIEMELGQPAFERSDANGFVPNALGERLADTARRMHELVSDTNAEIGGEVAPIRVASCEVTARAFVSAALSKWAAETGGRSDLAVCDNLFVLKPDDYDVLITPLDSAPQDLSGKRIASLEWRLYASREYLAQRPVAKGASSLAGHDVIHPSGSLAAIEAYKAFLALGGHVAMTTSSPVAQRDAAARGLGIAWLPVVLAEEAGNLVPVAMGISSVSEIWSVSRSPNSRHPRVSAFLDWAYAYFKNDADAAKSKDAV